MSNLFRRFLRSERGVSAIEYALIAGLVGVALIGGATILGTQLNAAFTDFASKVPAS